MARTISGLVESDGDKRSGEGFYSNRVGTGLYTVDFDQAFGQYPVVVCSPVTNIGGTELNISFIVPVVTEVEKHRVTIVMGAPTGGARDSAFSFIAIGD